MPLNIPDVEPGCQLNVAHALAADLDLVTSTPQLSQRSLPLEADLLVSFAAVTLPVLRCGLRRCARRTGHRVSGERTVVNGFRPLPRRKDHWRIGSGRSQTDLNGVKRDIPYIFKMLLPLFWILEFHLRSALFAQTVVKKSPSASYRHLGRGCYPMQRDRCRLRHR